MVKPRLSVSKTFVFLMYYTYVVIDEQIIFEQAYFRDFCVGRTTINKVFCNVVRIVREQS